jgi:hypothetical protein
MCNNSAGKPLLKINLLPEPRPGSPCRKDTASDTTDVEKSTKAKASPKFGSRIQVSESRIKDPAAVICYLSSVLCGSVLPVLRLVRCSRSYYEGGSLGVGGWPAAVS